MSRMLEALKQIEARSSQPQRAALTVPIEQIESQRAERPPGPPPADSQQSRTPIRDEAAIEATLAAAERAAAEATGTSFESISAPESRPSPPAEPAASCEPPLPEPETASLDASGLPPSNVPIDAAAEPYATLSGRILTQLPAGRPATLMFTGPGQTPGTIAVTVPLARALAARIADDVLLIDGNLRNPFLAERLGVETFQGLADVLTGMASWQEVVRETDVPRLSILPGVPFPSPNGGPPSRLNLQPLLGELRDRYRLILIAAPPLIYPEVAPLTRYCSGVYLFVRLGHTTRREAEEALSSIRRHQGRVLGSVVIQA